MEGRQFSATQNHELPKRNSSSIVKTAVMFVCRQHKRHQSILVLKSRDKLADTDTVHLLESLNLSNNGVTSLSRDSTLTVLLTRNRTINVFKNDMLASRQKQISSENYENLYKKFHYCISRSKSNILCWTHGPTVLIALSQTPAYTARPHTHR